MSIDSNFERISRLQYEVRALKHEISALKSGSAYERLEKRYTSEVKHLRSEIKQLKTELAQQERLNTKMRNCWYEVYENLCEEHKKALDKEKHSSTLLEERALKAEAKVDTLKDALLEKSHKIEELNDALKEKDEIIVKLYAQINKDFQNSSIPSSMQGPKRKKIPNTRIKTGRCPGAQPGHPHHPRRDLCATRTVEVNDPHEFILDPDLYKTDEQVRKKVVSARIVVEVIEYVANVWRRKHDGSRLHALLPCPETCEISYDGTVKALAHLLTQECCVSISKTKEFLCEASGGALTISTGCIAGLAKEFSFKSTSEKASIIESLMTTPIMHVDFTGSNVNGTSKQVLILANENATLIAARDSKGHKGVLGTPLQDYVGRIIHDHDTTFYSYGTTHQECLQHTIRYLVGSTQNEPELTWNHDMLALFREMLHWRNSQDITQEIDTNVIKDFSSRYDKILLKAKQEYESSPPPKYYRDGYNLSLRLEEYKEHELGFLYDLSIPPDNSLCERLARVFKRKMHQSIVFRSFDSLGYVCDSMSIINTMRKNNKDVFSETSAIFNRSESV